MSALLQAPADRPAGKRGLRGAAAAVAAIAALVTLAYGSRWNMPTWGRGVMIPAGAGVMAAAVLLWIARRPAALALAAALLVLAVPAWGVVESYRQREMHEAEKWGGADFKYDDQGPVVTREVAEAVPEGSTKDEVRAILGPAAGSGIQRVNDGKDMRCVVYRAVERPNWKLYALCFTGERYTDLREW